MSDDAIRRLLQDAGSSICPLEWTGRELKLLDQRLLPWEIEWIECRSHSDAARAISDMVVRGAPAIGITAAFGMVLAAMEAQGRGKDVDAALDEAARHLIVARPTAVNLKWAVDRMLSHFRGCCAGARDAVSVLEKEALAIWREDVQANIEMGRLGGELLPDGKGVLTHCNAGALATGGYGTALGVVRGAVAAGKQITVYADETRPWLQGARLTAWELMQDSIPVILNVDNAAGFLMSQGRIGAVVVGSDRIAANGDVANKIGTYNVAVLAKRHSIPFYVAAPVSTIDPEMPSGDLIPVEERSANEVAEVFGRRFAPEGVEVANPVFDITPAELVTAIITERGVLVPPYDKAIEAILS